MARLRELEQIRQFLTSSALTLIIDLFFATIFIGVLYLYSPSLTAIVAASIPLYVLVSLVASPMLKQRIDEKFRRGAENQSFLVESIAGIETVKAMALEPALQRRWEEGLAGYVTAAFGVIGVSTFAQQAVQAVSRIVTVGILFFGARSVITGELTIGELVAFNMIAGQVAQPVLRLAQLWQDFQQTRVSIDRLGDILNTPTEPVRRQHRACRRSAARSASRPFPSVTGLTPPPFSRTSRSTLPLARSSESSVPPARANRPSSSSSSVFSFPNAARADRRH